MVLRGVAQLVARLLWEQEVRGSSPRTPILSNQSLNICILTIPFAQAGVTQW